MILRGSGLLTAAAITLSLFLAPGLALAQQADNQKSVAAAANTKLWFKECPKKDNKAAGYCLTSYELRNEQGKIVSSLTIRQEQAGDKKQILIIGLPLGVILREGVKIKIDDDPEKSISYAICVNACYADTEVDDNFINQMKKGSYLDAKIYNNSAQEISLRFSLVGFTKAYEGKAEGKPISDNLKQQLQEKAKKIRNQLKKND